MDIFVRVVCAMLGALLVAATLHGLVVTLVVPRRLPGHGVAPSRVAAFVWRLIRRLFDSPLLDLHRPRCLGGPEPPKDPQKRLIASFLARDQRLGRLGPLALLLLFALWLGMLVLGFSLLNMGLDDRGFGIAVHLTGSSVLTLGVQAPAGATAITLSYLTAACGLIAFALEIGFLPTIHGHFTRREALLRVLESRAGQPAWGPEILCRAQLNGSLGLLGASYADWEAWSADIAEAHLIFPWLMLLRSSDQLQSWITGLTAVMDSAAMYLALCPNNPSAPEARRCVRMGFTMLRHLADALGIAYDPDPYSTDEIKLSPEEFARATLYLQRNGFPVERTAREAYPDFQGWRVNYDSIVRDMVQLLHAPPAQWSGASKEILTMPPVNRRPGDPEDAGYQPYRPDETPDPDFGGDDAGGGRPDPEVSVLTACAADRTEYLADAYSSLLAQEDVSWEWLIEIDGDRLPDLDDAIARDSRVRLGVTGRQVGTATARNTALVRSRAPFVQNLDADDQMLPGALREGIDALSADLTLAFAFGRTVHLLPDGTHEPSWRDRVPFPPGRIAAGAIDEHWRRTGEEPMPLSPVLWRKRFLFAYGGWAALPVLEDTTLTFAVASAHPCWYLDRDTQLYRIHPDQATLAENYLAQRRPSRRFLFERLRALAMLAGRPDAFAADPPPDPAEQMTRASLRRGLP